MYMAYVQRDYGLVSKSHSQKHKGDTGRKATNLKLTARIYAPAVLLRHLDTFDSPP